MKKIIYLFSITFLILQSCSSDNSSDSNSNNNPLVLVKSMTKSFLGSSGQIVQTYNYFYNNAKIDHIDYSFNNGSNMIETGKIVYTYNENLISKIEGFGSDNVLDFRYTYIYNNSNQVLECNQFWINDVNNSYYHSHKKIFTYNIDSTVSELYYEGTPNNPVQLVKKYTYTIVGGEIVSTIEANPNGYIVKSTNYSFDNKNYPFKNIIGNNLFLQNDGSGYNFNVIQEIVNYSTTSNTKNFTITYNSNNYPISIISSSTNNIAQSFTYY